MKEFLKTHGKFITTVLVVIVTGIAGSSGWLQIQTAAPGTQPKVIVVLPEDFNPFQGPPIELQRGPGDWTYFSRYALRSAIRTLKSDRTNDTDGKMLELFEGLYKSPSRLGDVEQAVAIPHPVGADPVTVSIIAKIALKVAIAILEHRAPNTASEMDDRLLKLLKLLDGSPFLIATAHGAIR